MTPTEAAALLNGREYTKEITRDEEAAFKAAGLVALFGASDDLAEFRGAWREEASCYGSATLYVNESGPLINDCDDDYCPYFKAVRANARTIYANWDEGGFSWLYVTEIPHETFVIMEDGDTYCRGIVFLAEDAA
ncbi:hypothetical protein CDQ92_13375 [Sphingopyxis bauzanensis]|uniref:Uncharacterized protein n=1 Tax=Sphingopyxis bauzanensis TaxID=651663 RepID=A0A246JRX8_9SPHN|nr:hypothetical protein [Sphingopyxis bauzanensis]OWQ95767.1 hypothetical protein CDQ92_13375 [Sphingopyxis bauzanensis]GGJ39868.1 hypothetical protein GCM10011393_07640 [Sphingopyxis bauzanensis]